MDLKYMDIVTVKDSRNEIINGQFVGTATFTHSSSKSIPVILLCFEPGVLEYENTFYQVIKSPSFDITFAALTHIIEEDHVLCNIGEDKKFYSFFDLEQIISISTHSTLEQIISTLNSEIIP